jgi:hypothetical protein
VAHERRPHLNDLTGLLAASLRGDRDADGELAGLDQDLVFRAAEHHAVLPLLAEQCAACPDLPAPFISALQRHATRHLAADLAREAELRRCLGELDRVRVPALLMKGAQLAYQYYPRPDLRPRIDTDVLIAPGARHDVDRVLIAAGYERRDAISGDLLSSQLMYVKRQDGLVLHAVDVHWRIANPQVFAGVLSRDELDRSAQPLPALGPTARGLSPVHALLLACLHRVAHHYDTDCLIWLYDIHLIASRFDPAEWRVFIALAGDRSVAGVCWQGLERARERFGTTWPAAVDASWPTERPEPTAAYLAGKRRLAGHLWIDLRALPTWSARWRLVAEQLFPPARYMREVYAPASAAPLPILYTRRVLTGARKWLVRF